MIRWVNTFPNVNIMARLEFKLANYNFAVRHINSYKLSIDQSCFTRFILFFVLFSKNYFTLWNQILWVPIIMTRIVPGSFVRIHYQLKLSSKYMAQVQGWGIWKMQLAGQVQIPFETFFCCFFFCSTLHKFSWERHKCISSRAISKVANQYSSDLGWQPV